MRLGHDGDAPKKASGLTQGENGSNDANNKASHARHGMTSSQTANVVTALTAGAVAGACAKTTIAPLERVKIIYQTTPGRKFTFTGVVDTIRQTAAKEGFKALYKGNGANMVRIMPYAAIQFMSHEQYKWFLMKPDETTLSPIPRFLAGAMAGTTATTCTYPLDLMRARLAIQPKDVRIYRQMAS
eukprot:Colp12_sorted_trinity150504_noHs@2439